MKAAIASALILAAAAGEVRAQELIGQDSSRLGDPSLETRNPWHGTVRLFLGGKQLDEGDWSPVDSQGEFAILTDFGAADWDVRLALDMRFAASDEEDFLGAEVISASWEVNVGVRKVFDTGSIVKPFIGAGLAVGGATLEFDGEEDSDSGIGVWFDAGVDISLGGPVSLGLEVSLSHIPIDIVDFETDAGGFRFGITLGFSW